VSMRISVIGTGYLGATHAACMAELGFDVVGVDVHPERIAALRNGRLPFYEPGLDEIVTRNIANGRLRFTADHAEAAAWADVHFLCVGTPQRADGMGADVSFLDAGVDALAPHLTRRTLVVGKSTVPVGTAARLRARLQSAALAGADVDLAWNPEFLREGFAVKDTLHPDRIVVGAETAYADSVMRHVYAAMIKESTPFLVTGFATAELVKLAANSFLATKISFINAMAEVCDAADADVVQLAEAIGYDERIGSRFLQAGVGFGGGCLPKDIRAFRARAGELGVGEAVEFLAQVDSINLRRRQHVVEIARELLGGALAGARVTVLGAAFKPDSDDIRDSPALAVAQLVHDEGADVVVHDPKAIDNARKAAPELDYSVDLEQALAGADIVLHLTEWREYQAANPWALAAVVRHSRVIDGRNALDIESWRAAGWDVRALGRARVQHRQAPA